MVTSLIAPLLGSRRPSMLAHAVIVEPQRVRVARGVARLIFPDLAAGRIELADIAGEVGREPDVAGLVVDQTMRTGGRGLELIFFDDAGRWVQPAQHVGP